MAKKPAKKKKAARKPTERKTTAKKKVKKAPEKKRTPAKKKLSKTRKAKTVKRKKKAVKRRGEHPAKAPTPLGVWPTHPTKENKMVRDTPCADKVEPAYWALPPWTGKNSLEKEAEDEGFSFFSFFGHGCRNFDAAVTLISEIYKDGPLTEHENVRLMLDSNKTFYKGLMAKDVKGFLPDAEGKISFRYGLVLARDREDKPVGATDGLFLEAGGKTAIVILHSCVRATHLKRRYLHQLLYCSLVSALLKTREKAKLDYVLHACEFPRLDSVPRAKETLGRLLFVGRNLGMSALPKLRCRQPWKIAMPFLLAARKIGMEDGPFGTVKEILDMAGFAFGALALTGPLKADTVKAEFDNSVHELKGMQQTERMMFVQLPHSPDSMGQMEELMEAIDILGTLGDRCRDLYKDNAYALEYRVYLEKMKENGTAVALSDALDGLRKLYAKERKDLTPETL